MLQSVLSADIFPIWIAIHKRDLFFNRDELHSSLGIHHSSDFPVRSMTLYNSISLADLQYRKFLVYISPVWDYLAVNSVVSGESTLQVIKTWGSNMVVNLQFILRKRACN